MTAPRNGDAAGALYVVEREGQVWRWVPGERRLFLDIRGIVSCCSGENGLVSIAFPPGYARTRALYATYTTGSGTIRVARFLANEVGTKALPSTRKVILTVRDLPGANHNGGQLAFGANRRLFVSTGDGSSSGRCDPAGLAQDLGSRRGKLLSISTARLRVGWRVEGYGFRNPWRFSFDRETGRLYVGDVGEDDWEEVNTRAARELDGRPENYGWDVYEGRVRSECPNGGLNRAGRLVWPLSVYGHGAGCSITGGFAYRGARLAALAGWYLYGDYCTGRIWRLRVRDGALVNRQRLLLDTRLNLVSFGEDALGELYAVHHGGSVWKLVPS